MLIISALDRSKGTDWCKITNRPEITRQMTHMEWGGFVIIMKYILLWRLCAPVMMCAVRLKLYALILFSGGKE